MHLNTALIPWHLLLFFLVARAVQGKKDVEHGVRQTRERDEGVPDLFFFLHQISICFLTAGEANKRTRPDIGRFFPESKDGTFPPKIPCTINGTKENGNLDQEHPSHLCQEDAVALRESFGSLPGDC